MGLATGASTLVAAEEAESLGVSEPRREETGEVLPVLTSVGETDLVREG